MLDTDRQLKTWRVYSRKIRNLVISDMAWEDAAFWGLLLRLSEYMIGRRVLGIIFMQKNLSCTFN